MTKAEMVARFWKLLQLDSLTFPSTRFSSDDVEQAIMEGIWETLGQVNAPIRWLHYYWSITLVANQEVYVIEDNALSSPGGFTVPAKFWKWGPDPPRVGDRAARWMRHAEVDLLDAQGGLSDTDLVVYDAGRNPQTEGGHAIGRAYWRIGVRPTPSAAGTLVVYYLRQPMPFATVEDGYEYPDLPSEYHMAPIYWAALHFASLGIESQVNYPVDRWAQLFRGLVTRLEKDQSMYHQRNQPQVTPLYLPSDSWMDA